jgi:hypothetical protein
MPENTGRFKKGQSGNPAGKPRDARNAALVALDKIGEAAAADIVRASYWNPWCLASLRRHGRWPEPAQRINAAADKGSYSGSFLGTNHTREGFGRSISSLIIELLA